MNVVGLISSRSERPTRKRVTRACDQCRQLRIRCQPGHAGANCKNCAESGRLCTANQTAQKRGPVKGYLRDLETTILGLDALVTTVLASEEPPVKDFVARLSQNPILKQVLDGVEERRRKAVGLSGFAEPYVPEGEPMQEPSTSNDVTADFQRAEDLYDDYDDDNSDAHSGSFSVDNQHQLHFIGRSSGLPFLSKVSRSDLSHQLGIWQNLHPIQEHLLSPVVLPQIDVQEQVLNTYFDRVHPYFPVVAANQFWNRFRAAHVETVLSDPFELLLLSMFSLSSQMDSFLGDRETPSDYYFNMATAALNRFYQQSHPTTSLALLLLSIREFGQGNLPRAWLYAGIGIRMAQELGLHVAAPRLSGTGKEKQLFNDDEQTVRRRLWFGCVKIDRYLAMYTGRPLAIRDSDWDTKLCKEEEEEPSLSGLYISRNDSSVESLTIYNTNTQLWLITGRILEAFYSVRKRNSAPDRKVMLDLQVQLQDWHDQLPDELVMANYATKQRKQRNVITLFTEYWCVVILLHRRFMEIEKEQNKTYAWEQCTTAAQNINDLVQVFVADFGLTSASAFLVYNIFHAGLIWVAALRFQSSEPRFAHNLDLCLGALNEMKSAHAAAATCHRLLSGTMVSPQQELSKWTETLFNEMPELPIMDDCRSTTVCTDTLSSESYPIYDPAIFDTNSWTNGYELYTF